MIQAAIMASRKDDDPLTSVKALPKENNSLATVYNPIFQSQGRNAIAPLEVDSLPSSIHSDGYAKVH